MSVATEQAHTGLIRVASALQSKSRALDTIGMHSLAEDLYSYMEEILEHQEALQEAERSKIRGDFDNHALQAGLMLEALLDKAGEEE